MLTNRGWVVYCTESETVIGHWLKQEDAQQFWQDSLLIDTEGDVSSEYKWAVFPALECTELLEV